MRVLTLTAILAAAICGPAHGQIAASIEQPQCYEGVGCPHKDKISSQQIRAYSCENLWLLRNTIFHQRGLCFQTERGKRAFSNGKCSVNSAAEVKLSAVERDNVATIEAVERQKRCS